MEEPALSRTSRETYYWDQMADPEYRAEFVQSQISETVSAQIRAMRSDRQWSQADLASEANTAQSTISQLEDPDYGRQSLTTLRRLAAVFDVGLVVRFVPFSEIAKWAATSTNDDLHVPSFADDPGHTREGSDLTPAPPTDIEPFAMNVSTEQLMEYLRAAIAGTPRDDLAPLPIAETPVIEVVVK